MENDDYDDDHLGRRLEKRSKRTHRRHRNRWIRRNLDSKLFNDSLLDKPNKKLKMTFGNNIEDETD